MNVYDVAEKRIDETDCLRPHKNILLYDMVEEKGSDHEYYLWLNDASTEELLSEVEVWVKETTDMAYYNSEEDNSCCACPHELHPINCNCKCHGHAYQREMEHDALYDGGHLRRYGFRDPGGKSALRVGARIYACPTCKEPNRLSMADKNLGYQCDTCADRAEGRLPG